MNEHSYQNAISMTRFAATVSEIVGIQPPMQADQPVDWFTDILKKELDGTAKRILIFSVDAVPLWLIRKYTDMFGLVYKNAPITLPFRSVIPTITPIDYAAMFSGALPEVNGVDRYLQPILSAELAQPLLKADSLIAAVVRAGLKTAVVTCSNGCIASMLSQSKADFFIIDGDDDAAMFTCAQEKIESGKYDFVFLYQLGFDYAMHAEGPESIKALNVLETIIKRFDILCDSVRRNWDGNSLVVFNCDHGAHCNADASHGNHGTDTSGDTDILHFFGTVKNG